ncbi:MAG: hypothetical protein UHW86_00425, partial [Spirochaetota bacterium]|nr:hypothetical protein [Spirochaetota bacterium]
SIYFSKCQAKQRAGVPLLKITRFAPKRFPNASLLAKCILNLSRFIKALNQSCILNASSACKLLF